MDPSTAPVAIITGGTAGLGAATARLFAKSGIRTVVNYNSNSDRAFALVKELQSLSPLPDSPTNFLARKADLGVRTELIRLVEGVIADLGRLDIVFSNGGWTKFRNIEDLDDNVVEEDWDRCFNMNVKSHLFLMHAAQKHLEKTEGVFITTSSLAGVKVSGSSLVSHLVWNNMDHIIAKLTTAGIFSYQGSSDPFSQGAGNCSRPESQGQLCITGLDADGMPRIQF